MSLYDPKLERDNCGFGLLAHMEGEASHKLVRLAMSALARMQHRGGISADGKTGDGCGLLLQKPDSFYRAVAEEKGWHLGRKYAVGMLFLNPDPVLAEASRRDRHRRRAGKRDPHPGRLARCADQYQGSGRNRPGHPATGSSRCSSMRLTGLGDEQDLDRRLYIARRRIEKRIQGRTSSILPASPIRSSSIQGALLGRPILPRLYLDLADIRLQSAICVFHQRFSTNTQPALAPSPTVPLSSPTMARSTPSTATGSGPGPAAYKFSDAPACRICRIRRPLRQQQRLRLLESG